MFQGAMIPATVRTVNEGEYDGIVSATLLPGSHTGWFRGLRG